MTTTALKSMLAIGAVCLMGGVLQAQEHSLNARVPFAFEVQSRVLPAGDYTFENAPGRPSASLLNRRTGKSCFVATHQGVKEGNGPTSILFHRYGGTYFLAEIRTSDASRNTVYTSKHEKELKRSPRGPEMALVTILLSAD